MITFKSIKLDDKDTFDKYSKVLPSNSYEYVFSSLYLWRNLCETYFTIIDDMLVIKKFEECKGNFFMIPYGNFDNKLNSLISLLYQDNKDIINNKFLFGDVDSNFINTLISTTNYKFEIFDDRDDYEYVYLTKDLINLNGSKYHGKRNHCNNFTKLYNPEIKTINSNEIIIDCLDLLDKWHEKKIICGKELIMERSAISDILNHLSNLNLKSIAIYVNNSLVGFSIGEIVNDTAIIHVERCDTNYRGIYAFINREFIIREFNKTVYVNRQEDCGEANLRKAKESYYPDHFIKKYFIKIQ